MTSLRLPPQLLLILPPNAIEPQILQDLALRLAFIYAQKGQSHASSPRTMRHTLQETTPPCCRKETCGSSLVKLQCAHDHVPRAVTLGSRAVRSFAVSDEVLTCSSADCLPSSARARG